MSMQDKPLYILGLTYFGQHDSSAVLLENGKAIVAAEEERFTRIKFDRAFPKNAISWCLRSASISINDISHVGFFWKPWKGIVKVGFYRLRGIFEERIVGLEVLKDLLLAEHIFRRETGYKGEFHHLDHHITHVASSFYASGFPEATIVSIDGRGESETCWFGEGYGNELIKHYGVPWPHSLGYLYSTLTQFLGFEPLTDEYKVMALASYGESSYIEEFRKILKRNRNGFSLDLKYFSFYLGRGRMFSDYWIKKFGQPRKKDDRFIKRHYDLASSVQLRLKEIVFELLEDIVVKTKKDNLCLAGGVFLNSVLVGDIVRSKMFKRVYTTPVSGDTGCALGAAYYIHRILLGNKRNMPFSATYSGSKFSEGEILHVLRDSGLDYRKTESVKTAAVLLSKGRVVGWFQGGSEFGQRALGNRSILADPRDENMKNRINRLVKYRENFRPFAPAVLEEFQDEYFEYGGRTPYMTEVHPVLESKRRIIPAVVHVDGTARLQTVSKKTSSKFWKLISNFRKITGVPVVLNTSFNVKGEPIVDSPRDAIRTFLNSGIDDVFIGDFWVSKHTP